ncbi:MAG TPA: DinB family protein [Fimbriimonas sp.]|nr:DinB family protein [Fimbriimonas sp.]
MDLVEQSLETWRINDRLNHYLLKALADEALGTPLTKGKSVGGQFQHIHNVRLMWLKPAAPDLLEGLSKLEGDVPGALLGDALTHSGQAIEKLLQRAFENDGKVKNFKPHAVAFLGYLIAHEADHRGQIEVALRQAGTPLPDKVGYGLWEWGVR